jgi:hypothetical protein
MLQGRKMNKLVTVFLISVSAPEVHKQERILQKWRITLSHLRSYACMYSFCSRYLSPLSAAPLVALVGFGLYELGFPSVSFDNCVSIRYSFKDICSCLNSKYPGCQMYWDWSTWTNPSGDLCNGMIGFLYICLLHPICSLSTCHPTTIFLFVPFLQYLPHTVHMLKSIFDRFAVLFTIPIVWLYAYLLTVGGAYRNAPPKTQFHCRTDRSGLIGGAPWYCLQFWRYNCSYVTIIVVKIYD